MTAPEVTAPEVSGPDLTDDRTRDAGPPPAAAGELFGVRLPLVQRYLQWLATEAVTRGLVGPREVPRLWERHLLNCAVVTDLLPPAARVVDVGSGAGLPGLVLAARRPDLQVVLVEPLLRRARFLDEVVADLDLADSVRVVRGRAEEVRDTVGQVDWVVARAVAPLDRLAVWCLPLLAPGGRLLAMKGRSAEAEVAACRASLTKHHMSADLCEVGAHVLAEPTRVVVVRRLASLSRKGRGR